MARRKNRPKRTKSPLTIPKNYRDDEYVLYIAGAETGILEAWTIDPELRDGDVREALRNLMRDMKRSGELPAMLNTDSFDDEDLEFAASEQPEDMSLIEWCILRNLKLAFKKHGPLDAEDTIGILTVINHSVGTWSQGEMRGQGYLNYIRDFLGGMGVQIRQLTEEEIEEMEIFFPPDDDDDLPARKMTLDG